MPQWNEFISGSPWAVIITRLPSFDISCPHILKCWESVRANPKLELVVACIQSSSVNGGNARSIRMAISRAELVGSKTLENEKAYLIVGKYDLQRQSSQINLTRQAIPKQVKV